MGLLRRALRIDFGFYLGLFEWFQDLYIVIRCISERLKILKTH